MSDIARCVVDVIEAQREYDKCYESCDTSPGYFCHDQREAVERARAALDAAIDARINEILDRREKEEG